MNDVLRRSAAHVFVESLNNPQLDDLDAHHLLKVLRVRDTDSISLSDGIGGWMTATLSKDASLKATCEIQRIDAPRWPLVVAFAPVKGEKPEVIVQKLTEIGIDEIIPLTPTRFSVVKWDAARAEKLLERLQRVAREAAMQSRRVWLPKVCGVTPLASVTDLSMRSAPAMTLVVATAICGSSSLVVSVTICRRCLNAASSFTDRA